MKKKKHLFDSFILLFLILIFVFVWLRGGPDKLYFDSDLARDLSEISRLLIGQNIIWLGPKFSVGLHASPFYYYLFYIPIFLSKGSVYSLIYFNIFLSALALFILGYFAVRKYGRGGFFAPLFIGLAPFWQEISIHPGNGFTYSIFLLGFLTALWFKFPIVLSSLLLGISSSMHPGALVGMPFLLYELIKSKTSFKNWILSVIAFLLPFIPLIAFEVITKAYWLRQLQIKMSYSFTLDNIPRHYFFGVLTVVFFTFAITLIKKRFGEIILGFFSILLLVNSIITPKPAVSKRPISKIEKVVEYLVGSGEIKNDEKIAVVSIKTLDTKTPQADDYRFFLRAKGFEVLEVSDYGKADKLVIFVEDESINWESWNSWETDQFKDKKLLSVLQNEDFKIVIYGK